MRAVLLSRSWGRRKLLVELPEGSFTVLYTPWVGVRDYVYVNGEIADSKCTLSSPAPIYVFPIGRRLGVVELQIDTIFGIADSLTGLRSFHLIVDGEVLYAEGLRGPADVPPVWVEEVCRLWRRHDRISPEVVEKLATMLKPDAMTPRDDRFRDR